MGHNKLSTCPSVSSSTRPLSNRKIFFKLNRVFNSLIIFSLLRVCFLFLLKITFLVEKRFELSSYVIAPPSRTISEKIDGILK
tara:strand:+ start:377 stop:625 length:249 start_codon:yes stop_codon:yes gene_type:complete